MLRLCKRHSALRQLALTRGSSFQSERHPPRQPFNRLMQPEGSVWSSLLSSSDAQLIDVCVSHVCKGRYHVFIGHLSAHPRARQVFTSVVGRLVSEYPPLRAMDHLTGLASFFDSSDVELSFDEPRRTDHQQVLCCGDGSSTNNTIEAIFVERSCHADAGAMSWIAAAHVCTQQQKKPRAAPHVPSLSQAAPEVEQEKQPLEDGRVYHGLLHHLRQHPRHIPTLLGTLVEVSDGSRDACNDVIGLLYASMDKNVFVSPQDVLRILHLLQDGNHHRLLLLVWRRVEHTSVRFDVEAQSVVMCAAMQLGQVGRAIASVEDLRHERCVPTVKDQRAFLLFLATSSYSATVVDVWRYAERLMHTWHGGTCALWRSELLHPVGRAVLQLAARCGAVNGVWRMLMEASSSTHMIDATSAEVYAQLLMGSSEVCNVVCASAEHAMASESLLRLFVELPAHYMQQHGEEVELEHRMDVLRAMACVVGHVEMMRCGEDCRDASEAVVWWERGGGRERWRRVVAQNAPTDAELVEMCSAVADQPQVVPSKKLAQVHALAALLSRRAPAQVVEWLELLVEVEQINVL